MSNERKLLAGLGEKVTIENVDQYMHQEGVIVRVHAGRIRGVFELSMKALGINLHSDETKEFFKNHVKNGSMSFIPMSIEKELHRIENRIRQRKTRMAIGYDNSYMPIDVYKEFQEHVKKARTEYMELRDQVLAQWEALKENFSRNLKIALSELETEDQEKVYKAFMARYPSKQEYKDSFYLETSLRAFPVMANLSLLDEDIREEVKESSIKDNLKMVHEVLGVAFDEAFQVANMIYRAYETNRKLPSKTKGSITVAIKSIKNKNVLKHPIIDELIVDLQDLHGAQYVDDALETAESIMAKAYAACNDLDLMNYLDLSDSELSAFDLEILAQSYVSNAA